MALLMHTSARRTRHADKGFDHLRQKLPRWVAIRAAVPRASGLTRGSLNHICKGNPDPVCLHRIPFDNDTSRRLDIALLDLAQAAALQLHGCKSLRRSCNGSPRSRWSGHHWSRRRGSGHVVGRLAAPVRDCDPTRSTKRFVPKGAAGIHNFCTSQNQDVHQVTREV